MLQVSQPESATSHPVSWSLLGTLSISPSGPPSIHPSMLLGSRLHTPPWIQVTLLVWVALCYPALCIVVCICHLIIFILLSNAVVNSWQTQLAFYLLLDTKHSPVDSAGISNIPAKWKLSRLAHVTASGTEKGGLEWEHQVGIFWMLMSCFMAASMRCVSEGNYFEE